MQLIYWLLDCLLCRILFIVHCAPAVVDYVPSPSKHSQKGGRATSKGQLGGPRMIAVILLGRCQHKKATDPISLL